MPTPLVTPLPALDRTDPAFREDVDTFFASQVPTFTVQINTLADYLVVKTDAAAASATAAAGSATSAASQVSLAAAQVTLATTQANNAANSATEANAAAAAAGAATGLNLTGQAGKSLVVNDTETAIDFRRIVQEIIRSSRTSNVSLGASDNASLIDVTSGTFTQTLSAVADLGSGWYVFYRNSGSGVVTIDPGGAETIDGAATKVLYPLQTVIIQCDGTALRTIALSGVGNHAVSLVTGNGKGSTNTNIRRFTTTSVNVGTAITYADSATLGASFTINETGFYSVIYSDVGPSGGNTSLGISVNSTQLSTSVDLISAPSRLVLGFSSNGFQGYASGVFRFAAGDVVRPHLGPITIDSASPDTSFKIQKVGS